jgi:hypothetical protein
LIVLFGCDNFFIQGNQARLERGPTTLIRSDDIPAINLYYINDAADLAIKMQRISYEYSLRSPEEKNDLKFVLSNDIVFDACPLINYDFALDPENPPPKMGDFYEFNWQFYGNGHALTLNAPLFAKIKKAAALPPGTFMNSPIISGVVINTIISSIPLKSGGIPLSAVGALACMAEEGAQIRNIAVRGSINITTPKTIEISDSEVKVGGLIGIESHGPVGAANIYNCSVGLNITVNAAPLTDGTLPSLVVGGLVGANNTSGIENCLYAGNITVNNMGPTGGGAISVGGLVGKTRSSIATSFANGTITAKSAQEGGAPDPALGGIVLAGGIAGEGPDNSSLPFVNVASILASINVDGGDGSLANRMTTTSETTLFEDDGPTCFNFAGTSFDGSIAESGGPDNAGEAMASGDGESTWGFKNVGFWDGNAKAADEPGFREDVYFKIDTTSLDWKWGFLPYLFYQSAPAFINIVD